MEAVQWSLDNSGGGAAGTSAAAAVGRMQQNLGQVRAMIDGLMPTVDSAVDELACTQNAAGDYCLLYTETMQGGVGGATS